MNVKDKLKSASGVLNSDSCVTALVYLTLMVDNVMLTAVGKPYTIS